MSHSMEVLEPILKILWFALLVTLAASLYFAPAIIAYKRKHSYKLVILGLNAIGFVGIVPWIAAFMWAAWPSDKSLIDPLAGNVTGKGRRNSGDTLGGVSYGIKRGFDEEKDAE